MDKQKLTVRQRQRIGAKMARYSRKIDSSLNRRNQKFRELLLEMVEECYNEGFMDGVATERYENERINTKRKRA